MLGHPSIHCWLLWFLYVFMLMFNVSSLPLMFYVVGIVGTFTSLFGLR